ncbi:MULTISPECIES: Spy/CpxP family protein refolding chaperone [Ramlibacter]|uniref:Spy/CpxP family protein refolding chaperone n=1 Tax=Ramlibacter aquaticus TaxID=2780094 RepID=A0ABR9SF51_9BURK|nr:MULTISPECIES: Spy/CpxP family protein refolding chaperone [Ramlibacter]MBE7940989.1 Spy/CpxP family protein refolding chaperone [Ramlibacter aquaticus]
MRNAPKHLLAAMLLATLAAAANAQTPPSPPLAGAGPGGPGGPGMMMPHHADPAKMAQRRAEHLARLKQKLQLTPAQEPAWQAFTAAMPQPPAQRPDPAEMEKLSTPERLDRMKAMRDARAADMDRMSAATKSFYAQLTPQQQKVFDQSAMPRHGGWHHGGN